MPKRKTGSWRACEECGNEFWVIPARADTAQFCSRACKDARHRFEERACNQCGTKFFAYTSTHKLFCSRSCYERSRTPVSVANCEVCSKPLDPRRGQHRFCSKECTRQGRRTGQMVPCAVCGTEVYRAPYAIRGRLEIFCSYECKNEALKLDGPGARWRRPDGYVQVYFPKHPFAGRGNRSVLEHRLVMEQQLGRYLRPEEQVHHINGIRDDNRPENLMLVDPQEHNRITSQKAKEKRKDAMERLAEYERRFGPLT